MRSCTCVCLALLVAVAHAALLPSLSFDKPYETISPDGERLVGDKWNHGGSTVVNRHFARLTPDRQNRRGWIWSKERIGHKDFSLMLTFRISGQAANWYGDGLALWITTSPSHEPGDNHGFTPTFRGFGVVFDTFVNQEHAGGHKDVTFFENDGTKSLDELNDGEKMGCMASGIRYHEKNAAFSPPVNMSRVKIQYQNDYIWISIDPKNTGDWQKCFQKKMTIPKEWIIDSTIGLTASTGGLADNHDVISLKVYDDVVDNAHDEYDQKVKVDTQRHSDAVIDQASGDEKLKMLKRKYEQLVEDFEHEFTALKESTESTIQKLREQEAEDSQRIQELEAWVNGRVNEKVSATLNEVTDEVESKLKKTVEETAKKTSSWKTPFFLLLVVLGGMLAAGYKKYQDLRKSHLL